MRTLLLIILLLLLIGSFPAFPYNSEWGFYPFSGIGLLLVVLLVLALLGY